MRLDPRKHLDEEIRNNPFKPKPYSTPFDAPPDSPSFLPGFKEKDPDTPDLPTDFPPEADKDGDGVVSQKEFIQYIKEILRANGFTEAQIRTLIKLIREGRKPSVGDLFKLRRVDQELLKRLLKRIQREFPNGTPYILPDDF